MGFTSVGANPPLMPKLMRSMSICTAPKITDKVLLMRRSTCIFSGAQVWVTRPSHAGSCRRTQTRPSRQGQKAKQSTCKEEHKIGSGPPRQSVGESVSGSVSD